MSAVFLLSPAHCGGRRAAALLEPDSSSPLAPALHAGTLTLGEAFSFISGLYFRGKLAYARAFGKGCVRPAILVITPTRGLQQPDWLISRALIEEFASIDVGVDAPSYREPLERDVAALASALPPEGRVVLLGSIATDKYVDVLAPLVGHRQQYPPSFIGRGDMSRGALLLRCAARGEELEYVPLSGTAIRCGRRPPPLDRLAKACD
ncbi:MAG: hypothetical protein AB7I50_17280 [Vicinamibacterales bacterium]